MSPEDYFGDLMADLVAWRIGADQIGKGDLKLGVAADQGVIFGVGNFGRIVEMISLVGAVNRASKAHKFVGGVGCRLKIIHENQTRPS